MRRLRGLLMRRATRSVALAGTMIAVSAKGLAEVIG
jgi:hypothetical protein